MNFKSSFLDWNIDISELKKVKKSVIIQAPHTSNWDFILGIIAAKKTNLNFRFIIKNSWNIFIIGWALKRLGAIFIDRSKATGLTQQIIGELKKAESGHIVFTPEGTRSIVKKWKTGFYVVAHNAHIPIAVGYIDYKTKTIGINQLIYPTGDIKKDLTPIQRFYEKITPKNPTNYEPFWEI